MKKLLYFLPIIFALVISCGKAPSRDNRIIAVGPGEITPARPDTEFVVDLYISPEADPKFAESLSVAILKEQIQQHANWKRAMLRAHSDTADYKIRREEIQLVWFGSGEPAFFVKNWDKIVVNREKQENKEKGKEKKTKEMEKKKGE